MEIRCFDFPRLRYRLFGKNNSEWIEVDVSERLKELPKLPESLEKLQHKEEESELNLTHDKKPFWDTAEPPVAYPFRLELLELIRAMNEEQEHISNGNTALNSLSAVLGMHEASQIRRVVFPISEMDYYPISKMLLLKK